MNSAGTQPKRSRSSERADLVDELCGHIHASSVEVDRDVFCDFARLFFLKAPPQLLEDRQRDTLVRMTLGAFSFLRQARAERVNVQVLNPEDEGWSAPVTVIRAEIGNRPFIVDTIREYLSAEDISIEQYIYPVLRVRRAGDGSVLQVSEPDNAGQESLVHCEIRRIDDAARRRELAEQIERRLGDVVAATDDFEAMRKALGTTMTVLDRERDRYARRSEDVSEDLAFLQWLRDDNFIFLGYRGYEIREAEGTATLRVQPGSGLGILRDESRSGLTGGRPLGKLGSGLQTRIEEGPSLVISKTNAEATVHRRARMDYVGLKKLNERGDTVGEHRFLGLFTSKAYQENAESIPILRRRLQRVLRASGAPEGSHDYKEIITIFNSMPKEELFQASVHELEREIQEVVALLFSDEVRVSIRLDALGRGASVMVILPRGKFSGEVRKRIQQALSDAFHGTVLNYHLAMSAGDQARLHFYLSAEREDAEAVDPVELEREIRRLIRSWRDRLFDELLNQYDRAEALRLTARYGDAFNDEYVAAYMPSAARHDIEQIERMQREDRDIALDLHSPRGRGRPKAFQGVTILKLYLRGEQLVLSDFMPILENAGLRVIEVTPFSVRAVDAPPILMYAFAVQEPGGKPVPLERSADLSEAILAVRAGHATNDPLNSLVLAADLRWRDVDLLRAYANYTFHVGAVPSRMSMTRALLRYPNLGRLLVKLFHGRFDPCGSAAHEAGPDESRATLVREAIGYAMEEVQALTDDRALRRMWNLIEATTRTNFFRHGGLDPSRVSGGSPYIAIKVRSADVEELRVNGLYREIFVFSARMEGVHLRGAPVSRGGIRWSDRPDDFRAEVLGLVRTQVVKNAVIVPGGSKGGFVLKDTPRDRDDVMHEVAGQYRTLIRGLLDLTDNIVDGKVVPPEGVVRHDEDDPYLVVAADKGTAHLSDVANELAAEYEFWLGDAFASGGSRGYDHKKEGITARGAWECVRRHFREQGKDIQREPFTAIGVGDMSGDVFGNGMLLSRQTRLLAAFDHRHIFIDPDPDAETGYAERQRLFQLPRSTWDDYDRAALSPGGIIVSRTAKRVVMSPEVRAALGLADSVEHLDGEGLVRAILSAPAELFWNGGIGTYVKASTETHTAVGDTANDPVRVNADELRCQVIGEGGNLGLTQRARIEFALGGGRSNTDALDNSAGVDMSDHEVNLKILLGGMIADGEMTADERNGLLAGMTDEVTELVLRNSFDQSLAVSLDAARSRDDLWDFAALLTTLERGGLLRRGVDGLPTTETFQERADAGEGLTRPVLATLLAYAKISAKTALLASPLPDDAALLGYLRGYFPQAAVKAVGEGRLLGHRLHRDIVATETVNDLVDLMGASFLNRMARDTGHDVPAVIRAWLIASNLAGSGAIREELRRAEAELPAESVYRWLHGLARVLEHTSHWALTNLAPDAPAEAVIEQHRDGLRQLQAGFPDLVAGADRELFHARLEELRKLGVERDLAERFITLRFLPQLLEILRIARELDAAPPEAARVYYLVSEEFGCATLWHAVRAHTRDDRWEKRYAQEVVEDIGRARRSLTRTVLRCMVGGADARGCLAELENTRAREVAAYRELRQEIEASDNVPLTGYGVAVRALTEVAELRTR